MFCLIKKVVRHKMKRIQSKLHSVGTYELNKISLSCFDDKRFVLNDGINTLFLMMELILWHTVTKVLCIDVDEIVK